MWRAVSLLLTLALGAGPAPAQQAEIPPSPLLVINQERLLTGSALGQMVAAVDEAEKKVLAGEGESLSVALEAEEKALTEKRKQVTPEAFRILADEFDTRVVAIRADQDVKAAALGAAIEGRRRQFYNRIAPVLLAIMQKYQASVMMDQRSVILSVRSVNVTDEAVARIDATYKTLADIGITD